MKKLIIISACLVMVLGAQNLTLIQRLTSIELQWKGEDNTIKRNYPQWRSDPAYYSQKKSLSIKYTTILDTERSAILSELKKINNSSFDTLQSLYGLHQSTDPVNLIDLQRAIARLKVLEHIQ